MTSSKCPEAPKKQYYNNTNYMINNTFEDSEFYQIELSSLIFGPNHNQRYLFDQYYYQQKKLEWENNNLIILNNRLQRNIQQCNNNNNNNDDNNNNNNNNDIINYKIQSKKTTKLFYN